MSGACPSKPIDDGAAGKWPSACAMNSCPITCDVSASAINAAHERPLKPLSGCRAIRHTTSMHAAPTAADHALNVSVSMPVRLRWT